MPGHDHMSDDHAAPQHFLAETLSFKYGRPHLTCHLRDRKGCALEIVRRIGIACRQLAAVIFQVGKIDIDKTLEHPHGLHLFVGGCVVHDRDRKSR